MELKKKCMFTQAVQQMKVMSNITKQADKQLFTIDGYKIWAYNYDEAYKAYQKICSF